MRRVLHLVLLLLPLLVFFALGKLGFMLYNGDIESVSCTDMLAVILNGSGMDRSTSGYLLILPWLMLLVSVWYSKLPLRKVLLPYYIIVALLLSIIVCSDAFLYEFWKFKLNASIFTYMQNAEGVTNSVSLWYMISRTACIIAVAIPLAWVLTLLTPKTLPCDKHRIRTTLLMLLTGGLTFVMIRGGVQESTMNVGQAYFSQRLFLNHSAVNPAFSLLSSIKRTEKYSEQFNYLQDEELAEVFDGLYPAPSTDITDTLLRTQRPQILLVLMESFGGRMIKELGGEPDVSPNLSRLIDEGIFWENYYSNSFRTDRGTVSALSGHISYPSASLMRLPDRLASVPGLARTLSAEGYSTTYLYGGDIEFLNTKGYLIGAGFENLISDKAFSFAEVNESKWGANDSLTALRTFQTIATLPQDKPWMMGYQTLSSHEPWEVNYHRLEDPVKNAFAYTDKCVGMLVDSLRTLPVWDNLLVILIPDHGIPHHCGYDNPLYFHSPMIWTGGAIKEPRRMSVLMNQSDLCATLLSQMGIRHDDYMWSRNVLSKSYTYPFAYSNYPSGILFTDSTGLSIFDINAGQSILEQGDGSDSRLLKAKAILQRSYDLLDGAPTLP